MAIIDIPGFVADLKSLAVDRAFHVHDERHYVETYSLRQSWEVDLHPDYACGGPLDLHLAVEVEPRTMLAFEDRMLEQPDDGSPVEGYILPIVFVWGLPELRHAPDLLVLATEVAALGGIELPLEISAVDSFDDVTDAPARRLQIASRIDVGLDQIYLGDGMIGAELDRCHEVSTYLLTRAGSWLGEE